MLVELIEKKDKQVKTRFKFTRKEWNKLPLNFRSNIAENYEVYETVRNIYYDVDGDLLNKNKKEGEMKNGQVF